MKTWLATVGKYATALQVLTKINGPVRAEQELGEIEAELGVETNGFGELFRPGIRMAVAIGIALMVFSQINGVNMILLYTPTLFLEAGITSAPDAILNSVYIDGWIVLCTIVAFWLTRTFGRRSILIVGTLAMAVGHLLMFLSFTFAMPTAFILMAMLVPTGAFTLTLAPLGPHGCGRTRWCSRPIAHVCKSSPTNDLPACYAPELKSTVTGMLHIAGSYANNRR